MKKVIIIILLFSIFLIGCNTISADTIISTTAETTIITETTINHSNNTINYDYDNLKAEYDILAEDKQKLEDENKAYDYLIRNLNNLLRNVYYGEATNDVGGTGNFTGFTIYYKNKYYILTAGHCVENENGKFSNFKFKANFSNEWIYPKLLAYKYNRTGLDYAIFIEDKINNGFVTFNNNSDGKKYILGSIHNNLNVFKEFDANAIQGESGSPIINIKQELIGICTSKGSFTGINVVLTTIDK